MNQLWDIYKGSLKMSERVLFKGYCNGFQKNPKREPEMEFSMEF